MARVPRMVLPPPTTHPGRARRWKARFILGPGGQVVLRQHLADVLPDEDVVDDPPTVGLTWDEWLRRHAEFGLTVDGEPQPAAG